MTVSASWRMFIYTRHAMVSFDGAAQQGQEVPLMAGIDEVLERLVTEPDFRERLRMNPAAALSGYVLYDEDLEILATSLDEAAGGERVVEQRTSKSALLVALTGLLGDGGAAAGSGGLGPVGSHHEGTAGHGDGLVADSPVSADEASHDRYANMNVSYALDPPSDDQSPAAMAQPSYPGVYVEESPSGEPSAAQDEVGSFREAIKVPTKHSATSSPGAEADSGSTGPGRSDGINLAQMQKLSGGTDPESDLVDHTGSEEATRSGDVVNSKEYTDEWSTAVAPEPDGDLVADTVAGDGAEPGPHEGGADRADEQEISYVDPVDEVSTESVTLTVESIEKG